LASSLSCTSSHNPQSPSPKPLMVSFLASRQVRKEPSFKFCALLHSVNKLSIHAGVLIGTGSESTSITGATLLLGGSLKPAQVRQRWSTGLCHAGLIDCRPSVHPSSSPRVLSPARAVPLPTRGCWATLMGTALRCCLSS